MENHMKEKNSKNISCPSCHSRNVVFMGYRYNEKTKKRLRLCKKCGRKFTLDDGFLRMRFGKKDILLAVKLHKKGYSLAEVRNKLRADGTEVSRWTIAKWYRKYGR